MNRREECAERKPRLLVIPHICAADISIREIEFAKRLQTYFDVFCLWWPDAQHVDGPRGLRRRWKQFRTTVRSLSTRSRLETRAGLTYIHGPVLQPMLLQRAVGRNRAVRWARSLNRIELERWITRYGITHVLEADGIFGLPRNPGVRVYCDLVDWVPEENWPAAQVLAMRESLARTAAQVNGIFAVSEGLCEKLRDDCGIRAIPLPNGANLKALRSVPASHVAQLRERLGLEDRFVIGYIGNHGSYTGIDFVVEVFRQLQRSMPDAALLIVGPAEHWRHLLEGRRGEGIFWTGPVPPSEVAAYFQAIDLGILAQEKSFGTEFAFQIKNVEYTACRKFVISTPLRTWQRLRWPNILLANLTVEEWVAAIQYARTLSWSPSWDGLTDPYEWEALARQIAQKMLEETEIPAQCAS